MPFLEPLIRVLTKRVAQRVLFLRIKQIKKSKIMKGKRSNDDEVYMFHYSNLNVNKLYAEVATCDSCAAGKKVAYFDVFGHFLTSLDV